MPLLVACLIIAALLVIAMGFVVLAGKVLGLAETIDAMGKDHRECVRERGNLRGRVAFLEEMHNQRIAEEGSVL